MNRSWSVLICKQILEDDSLEIALTELMAGMDKILANRTLVDEEIKVKDMAAWSSA